MSDRKMTAYLRLAFACAVAGIALRCAVDSPSPGPSAQEAQIESTVHIGESHPPNRLAQATSPYLLLHAHNPVDWFPWGPEAFQKARDEDKPIFLSVGYSTCFWCHVMERRVFSDPDIAALMNRHFISIKVDREERPDVDALYMTATQLVSGHGGWPNSVFLTPDLEPFYAGTYFPPEDDDRIRRPGFPTVLNAIHDIWINRREEATEQARRITEAIRREHSPRPGPGAALTYDMIEQALRGLRLRYDPVEGGFGTAPKFPPNMALALLHAAEKSSSDTSRTEMLFHTLRRMASGGIHDHLAGGFHRYATDGQWRVPHFEKMLYTQALLAKDYLRAFEATGEDLYRSTAEGIFRFVKESMTSPDGAFYSALDAQTDGEEGVYYVWTETQIRDILGPGADPFFKAFALEPLPESDGSVLYRIADDGPAPSPQLEALGDARRTRLYPFLDDKVITSWNGLMIDAYAEGYRVLGNEEYGEAAERAARFTLSRMTDSTGEGLYRTWRLEKASVDGYQEDYAFFVRGLMGLHRATGRVEWLDLARGFTAAMDDRFLQDTGGYAFAPPSDHLIVPIMAPQESAIPSGNSQASHNLIDLYEATGDTAFLASARRTLEAFSSRMQDASGSMNHMTAALARYLSISPGDGAAPTSPSVSLPMDRVAKRLPAEPGIVSLSAPDSIAATSGQPFTLSVSLDIADDWHINANPASLPTLIPTVLTLTSDLMIAVRAIRYPVANRFDAGFADEAIEVYGETITVGADVTLDSDVVRTGTLLVQVTYQACDASRCLAPSTIEREISLTVSPDVGGTDLEGG